MYTKYVFALSALLIITRVGIAQAQLPIELSTNGKASVMGIVGQPAPELKVKQWIDADGKVSAPIQLKDYTGKFVVIYNFQAWCPACHSVGLPALKRMSDELKDHPEVRFIAIQTVFEGAHANTYERMVEIKQEYEIAVPFGHDPDDAAGTRNISSTMNSYRSGGTPWYILIDQEGKVVFNDFHIDVDKTIAYLKDIK